jgi:flagellar hook-associated protein 1 FlgK
MAGLLSIALTGLNAAQSGLTTTSHNITNASVAGYTRQETVQGTTSPLKRSSGFYGQGTQVETVKRVYSEFLSSQVLAAQSSLSSNQTYYDQIKQLDNVLGDDTAGLSTALSTFFKGVSQVAATPSDASARQAMLSETQTLVTRFQSLNSTIEDLKSGTETQIKDTVKEINTLAGQIASANMAILKAQAGSGQTANDLLDTRDELITQLSKLVKVATNTDANGVASVSIGTGQALVEGTTAFNLSTATSATDPQQVSVGISLANGNVVTIPDDYFSGGGSLGGLMSSRAELNSAQNGLGRIAASLVTLFNAQHKLGQDLQGNMGTNYFSSYSPTVQNLTNTITGAESGASISASITSVAGLTADDYVLSYDGTNYTLTDNTDNSVVYTGTSLPGTSASRVSGLSAATVSISASANANGAAQDMYLSYDGSTYSVTAAGSGDTLYSGSTLPSEVDGMTISVSGSLAAGDTFLMQPGVAGISLSGSMSAGDQVLIQPTKNAAGSMALAISDTNLIAAASPVAVAAANTNSGTGSVSQPTVLSLTGIDSTSTNHLASNITLKFDSTTNQFNVTGATPATIAFDPSANAAGMTVTLTDPNMSFKISGRPSNGDVFTISSNTNGKTDSSNANALYAVMSDKALLGGSATLSGAYTQLVNKVASVTSTANTSVSTQTTLLDNATTAQQSLSGVNLDEEAANLLEYQQAYQAAARCITVAQTLFQDIISAMS